MFAIQIRVVFNLKMQQKKSAAHVQAKKERASNQMMYSHGLNTKPILYLKVNGSWIVFLMGVWMPDLILIKPAKTI